MIRVSVVIPTYNRSWCILRAIDSVLAQTFRDIDIWVVDDGGTDDTRLRVEARAGGSPDIPVHYVRTDHRGVSAARNKGVRLSGGPLVAFLDSDDAWLPEKLDRQIVRLDSDPDAALVHCDEIWVRNGREVRVPGSYRKFGGEVYEHCLPVCMIGPSTVVMRRSIYDEVGGFDESFPVCEDYDLWLRVTSRWSVALVDEPLIRKYGGHSDQLSTTTPTLDYWRIRALCRIAPTIDPGTPRHTATLNELRRRGMILSRGYEKHGRESERCRLIREIRKVDPDFGLSCDEGSGAGEQ